MKNMCNICKLMTWILIIGGIQLGLMGILDWDLLGTLTGGSEVATRVLYGIIGFATIGVIANTLGKCKNCKA